MAAEVTTAPPILHRDDRTGGGIDLASVAGQIAVELEPLAKPLDHDPDLLADSYAVFRRFGYLAAPAPLELGGGGAHLADLVRAQRIIAASCSNSALAVNMHLFQAGALADRWRTDGAGEHLLRSIVDDGVVLASTTGEAISLDPFVTSTTAYPTHVGYRLDGRKFFCSQARVMDLVRVLATDAVTGELVLVIVPADSNGLTVVEPAITMGMRGTQSFDLVLDGVEVADTAIALRFAQTVPLAEPSICAGAVWFLFMLAGVYAGVADGARTEAIRARRAARPSLGRIERLLYRIDAVLNHGLARYEAEPDLDQSLRLAAATKDEVISTANELVDECVTVIGATAYSTGSRLEQSVRDVRAGRHHPPDPATLDRLLSSREPIAPARRRDGHSSAHAASESDAASPHAPPPSNTIHQTTSGETQ